MRKFAVTMFATVLIFVGCAKTAESPLLQDARLVVAGLQIVSDQLKSMPTPPSPTVFTLVDTTLVTTQKIIADIQTGATKPDQGAGMIVAELKQLAPVVLQVMNANPTVSFGVNAVLNMIPLILADAGVVAGPRDMVARTSSPTPRADLTSFVQARRK